MRYLSKNWSSVAPLKLVHAPVQQVADAVGSLMLIGRLQQCQQTRAVPAWRRSTGISESPSYASFIEISSKRPGGNMQEIPG